MCQRKIIKSEYGLADEEIFIDDIYPEAAFLERRETVRGVVFDTRKRVALLYINCTDHFGERDHFELPGGGVKVGELLTDSALREALEECGALVKNIKLHGMVVNYYNILPQGEVINHLFSAKVMKKGTQLLSEEEKKRIKKVIWVHPAEALRLLKEYPTDPNVGILVHRRDHYILSRVLKELGWEDH